MSRTKRTHARDRIVLPKVRDYLRTSAAVASANRSREAAKGGVR